MEKPDTHPISVYVVDDEPLSLRTWQRVLPAARFRATYIESASAALHALAQDPNVDVLVTDLSMPEMSGMELLRRVKGTRPEIEVVMMTAHASLDRAVEAVKLGAFHFLAKPFPDLETPVLLVSRAAEHKRLLGRTRLLESELRTRSNATPDRMIGSSSKMAEVGRLINAAAPTSVSVLILGESGTGKELVARAIHERSDRRGKKFVAVNCSALAETLLESELFGHTKGSFTGASHSRAGLFEAADGGTMLLDEIGDAPPSVQAKLLRVLQEGEIRPVGSSRTAHVDVRVIAATNVELSTAVERGSFRHDLFYRLNVLPIHLPPLRERVSDIGRLAYHFLIRQAAALHRDIHEIDADALAALEAWSWPGNVRELENAMEHAVVLARGHSIAAHDLPEPLRPNVSSEMPTFAPPTPEREHQSADVPDTSTYGEAKARALRAFESTYVTAVMKRSDGNVSEAARIAGLDRSNFRRILKRTR